MNLKSLIYSVPFGLALSVSAIAGALVIKEPEVRTIITDAGYGDPVLIEMDGKLWRVKSIDNDSDAEVTLFVNQEGEILGAAEVVESRITKSTTTTTTIIENLPEPLTESSVATIVMNAGFHNVHDIDFLDGRGVWKAEADDISGEDYELHVNPHTGMIVHIEDD
jgi:hypothetical protein